MQIQEEPVKVSRLQVELAAVIDAGKRFVKATDILAERRQSFLALKIYMIVHNMFAGVHVQHFPNLLEVAQTIYIS